LAVHVGSLHHLGMDGFSTYYPVHALGHPFGIAYKPPASWRTASLTSFRKFASLFSRAARHGCRFLSIGLTDHITPLTCRWIFTMNWSAAPKEGERLSQASNLRRENVRRLRCR
jgi:hypothetical protein